MDQNQMKKLYEKKDCSENSFNVSMPLNIIQ